jgi:hypothetical protein
MVKKGNNFNKFKSPICVFAANLNLCHKEKIKYKLQAIVNE